MGSPAPPWGRGEPAEAGWLSRAEAAGEDGGGCSTAGLDRRAAAQRAATQEGYYQVSSGPRFRFGTRGGGAARLVRLRDASPPRRCPSIAYSSVPPPSPSRGPGPGRPERPRVRVGGTLQPLGLAPLGRREGSSPTSWAREQWLQLESLGSQYGGGGLEKIGTPDIRGGGGGRRRTRSRRRSPGGECGPLGRWELV